MKWGKTVYVMSLTLAVAQLYDQVKKYNKARNQYNELLKDRSYECPDEVEVDE